MSEGATDTREAAIRRWIKDQIVLDGASGGGEVLAALGALVAERDRYRATLANLRDTVDSYVNGDVGIPELGDAMDLSYAALYPVTEVPGG